MYHPTHSIVNVGFYERDILCMTIYAHYVQWLMYVCVANECTPNFIQ